MIRHATHRAQPQILSRVAWLLAALIVVLLSPQAQASRLDPTVHAAIRSGPHGPAIIAHRGASALLPEHTLEAYARAIEDGAVFIEPDLVMTRDGILVARHEKTLGDTTDIAAHPDFAQRRSRRVVDGVEGIRSRRPASSRCASARR